MMGCCDPVAGVNKNRVFEKSIVKRPPAPGCATGSGILFGIVIDTHGDISGYGFIIRAGAGYTD